ncbi:MAG: NAD(P)-dependent oxidoreductase [Bacteroidales bacterium]|jgi:nucleoside-diphosphate-sugar epimerase|nr:NAD(P)-dependent oxidoreductase [Bacteroidales bacterium]
MNETKKTIKVAITGAAGNLGNLLAQEMKEREVKLNLLFHDKDVADNLKNDQAAISLFRIDLANPETLTDALRDVDVLVHFAGVLFKARPEKFLPVTNTVYFQNLLNVALRQGVKRVILISFPHVEGESNPENPASGTLCGNPRSVHARTRLEEEIHLFEYGKTGRFEAVSLRVGMVYGRGVLMIDAALWLARHRLLGVWKKPTYIHLISKVDFVNATIAAIEKPDIQGIFHIGDDGKQTLQQFLDDIAVAQGSPPPWRMPMLLILTAARCCEFISLLFNQKSPLTVDFIRIGCVSYYGDTRRMRRELLPELRYKTYMDGIELFNQNKESK